MSEVTPPSANRLLSALPAKEYQRLLPQLEEVPLKYAATIHEPGAVIEDVYFPESGIVSVLAAAEKESTLEVGLVGSEGIVGLPIFLGIERSRNLAIVQGEGTARRINTEAFRSACQTYDSLPAILKRYTHLLLAQISQSAVCYRFHSVEARLVRWLLMTADRMKSNEFSMTQEFLSNMLGVRREAVNIAAGSLQKQQLISYRRGFIGIHDRTGLENAVCICYGIIREEEASYLAR